MKFLCTALLAAGLMAGASAATAAERESVSLKVDAAQVDFADPASVAELRRQAERKIEEACNPGDRVGADMRPDFRCRREMAANLDPTLYRLAMRATQQRMATVD
jgi:UrcA family protein